MSPRAAALELLRGQGLLPDGPLLFGQPVPSSRPGVYVVEWPAVVEAAPIDHAALRAWLARVPNLRLDGSTTTPHDLAARLASFWQPDQTVVYVGMTRHSLRRRLADFAATPLGDAGPHRGGHWLKTLRGLEQARVWWAETDAPEEYEDALLTAFAHAAGAAHALPFGNLISLGGGRRDHGLTGSTLAPVTGTVGGAAPVGPAQAAGTARAAAPRRASPARAAPAGPRRAPSATPRRAPGPPPRAGERSIVLTADGVTRIGAELDDLRARRPEVIGRVKAARELGDLKENSEYHAAREEQSFLEGRILQLQATLDQAVVTEAAADDGLARVGSTLDVAVEGEEGDETATYTLVDPAEARLAEGRLSYRSPIGAALLGRRGGDVVTVATPAGPRTYRVVAVR